jgi:four helix bundle protein
MPVDKLNQLPVGDLKDLVAWQAAMDFAESVYHATRGFPADERFGLRLQVRRAAVSVAYNIAEGHGRVNKREYARFVSIARGSVKEAETQLLLALRPATCHLRQLGHFSTQPLE